VLDGCDVVCVARNDALLDGLLTVFHVERSSDELLNLQNDLPLLSDYDKECIISLAVVRAGQCGSKAMQACCKPDACKPQHCTGFTGFRCHNCYGIRAAHAFG